MKNLAALVAASSLMLASSSAIASTASSRSLSSIDRASASSADESNLMDSGFMGFIIVFGAGAAVGALIYSLIKGGSNDEPVSP